MRRREFIALVGGAAAWPLTAHGQERRLTSIGALCLTNAVAQSFEKEFRDGLRELGHVEGPNLRFELRSADGNASQLPELAAELVRLKVDVIMAIFTPCALAVKDATTSIPLVMVAVGDPIGTGLVTSLARPGGNMTGLSNMGAETAGKCVELFHDILPSLRRVAVLANPADPFTKSLVEQVEAAGRTAGVAITPAMVTRVGQIDPAFDTMSKEHTDAVVVQAIFFSRTIADLAIKYRLPTAAILSSFVEAGGLMSYGANLPDLYRRSATFAHKILQGAKPADISAEQPTKFELAINLKTAKAIGLTITDSFLLRADKVIE
jgi:putative ABC transport system substrate-binding protein